MQTKDWKVQIGTVLEKRIEFFQVLKLRAQSEYWIDSLKNEIFSVSVVSISMSQWVGLAWKRMWFVRMCEIVMDPSQIFLTQFGSIFCSSGRVRLGQTSLVWVLVWKIFPKNPKFFNFFSFGSKKIPSGRVKKYPGQRRVGLLFTAGQKYAQDTSLA